MRRLKRPDIFQERRAIAGSQFQAEAPVTLNGAYQNPLTIHFIRPEKGSELRVLQAVFCVGNETLG